MSVTITVVYRAFRQAPAFVECSALWRRFYSGLGSVPEVISNLVTQWGTGETPMSLSLTVTFTCLHFCILLSP